MSVEVETPEEQTERLRQFVLDYCDGNIFTDRQCSTIDEVRMCFMPLVLAGPGVLPNDMALIYEHRSKKMPLGVNGMPIFSSIKYLTTEELARVQPVIEAELKRRSEVKV